MEKRSIELHLNNMAGKTTSASVMHSSCLASPGKIILWQYPISSVLWLACQGPVTTNPFRASFIFLPSSHTSSQPSFIHMLFYSSSFSPTCSRSQLFTSLFSISPPHLFWQPFLGHSFLNVLDSGLFYSLFLLLVIIFNLFLLGLILSLLLFSSSSSTLLIAPLVGSLFLVILSLGLLTALSAATMSLFMSQLLPAVPPFIWTMPAHFWAVLIPHLFFLIPSALPFTLFY